MNEFVPFIVFALPILLGTIIAKRYNFIFGFISTFIFAYLINFIFIESGFIETAFIDSVEGLLAGLNDLKTRLVIPFNDTITLIFDKAGQLKIHQDIVVANKYNYLGFMFLIYIILHIISAFFRKRRINEIKKLKRENRRY